MFLFEVRGLIHISVWRTTGLFSFYKVFRISKRRSPANNGHGLYKWWWRVTDGMTANDPGRCFLLANWRCLWDNCLFWYEPAPVNVFIFVGRCFQHFYDMTVITPDLLVHYIFYLFSVLNWKMVAWIFRKNYIFHSTLRSYLLIGVSRSYLVIG